MGDAEALEAAVAAQSPDLAIADIRMPPGNEDDGARAAARIRRDHPDVAVLLLSQHVETRHSLDLVAKGGFGYLLKDRVLDVDDFLDALRRVAGGGSALDPEVVAALVGNRRDDPLEALSPREREVLALMAEGRTNAGIARRLWLTDRTVETHVQQHPRQARHRRRRGGPPPRARGARASPRQHVGRSRARHDGGRPARREDRTTPSSRTPEDTVSATDTTRHIDVAPSRRAGLPYLAAPSASSPSC